MILLSNEMLSALSEQASHSLRRRKHFNIHSSCQDSCQRFFNAIQINSYIHPHRHCAAGNRELLVAIRGSFSLITFDDHGDFIQSFQFGTEQYAAELCPNVGVEIPPNSWHTVLANQDDSILLEVKEGPFNPDEAKELASWASKEGSELAASFLDQCYKYSEIDSVFSKR